MGKKEIYNQEGKNLFWLELLAINYFKSVQNTR